MRPTEHTNESIVEAGQRLQAEGRNVTGFAIRERIGGGKPGRLLQVWNDYQESQVQSQAETVAKLPLEIAEHLTLVTDDLAIRMNALVVALNDQAVKTAERRIAEVQREAGERQKQSERELDEASHVVDALEGRLDDMAGKVETLEGTLSELQATNHAQVVEAAQLRERLAAHEQRAVTAADQYAAEQTRLARVQSELDVARAESSSARVEAAKLMGQVEVMRTQIVDLNRALGVR